MDCSLHPLLLNELIKIFKSKKTNPNNAQLIFTTHNTKYLREKTFRRDQIWLIEKNAYGCSTLFSLFDFDDHVRKDGSWEKDYLFGLYGAVPNVQYLAEDLCTDYE